jgi:excinuclease ABC subunit A
VAEWAGRQGFDTLLVDGQFVEVESFERLARFKEHNIDVIVGEVDPKTKPEDTLEMVETALRLGKRTMRYLDSNNRIQVANTEMADPETGRSFEELDPRLFSYNSPHGWCPLCRGYGTIESAPFQVRRARCRVLSSTRSCAKNIDVRDRETRSRSSSAPNVKGARINEVARFVRIDGMGIHDIAGRSVADAREMISGLKLEKQAKLIARDILPEITQRLKFMEEVGLGYLQLHRSATTVERRGKPTHSPRRATRLQSAWSSSTCSTNPRSDCTHATTKSLLDTLAALKT